MTPFTLFLRGRLDRIRPLPRRCALRYTAIPASMASSRPRKRFCARCPASKSSTCSSPPVGLQANNLRVLPQYRRTLQEQELLAAEAAGVDALVAV